MTKGPSKGGEKRFLRGPRALRPLGNKLLVCVGESGAVKLMGAAHQVCIFHLFNMIGDRVYAALQSKRYSYRDKIKLCIYFTAIKSVFRTVDLQITQERLERLLDDYWNIPRCLRGFITGKILPDVKPLTLFMQDGLVSKTTNPVEN